MDNETKQGEKTSINSPISIVGNIKAEGDLILNGNLKGNVDIKNHKLVLGPTGRLKGNIYGQNINIQGHISCRQIRFFPDMIRGYPMTGSFWE